ncbi:hypothetical protein THAOC_12144, partial [Thalassiosira oceanica]
PNFSKDKARESRPEREGTKMLGSIVEDHRTIDLDVKWHGEFDGATLKGRYSTGKKLRTKARDRANWSCSNEAMATAMKVMKVKAGERKGDADGKARRFESTLLRCRASSSNDAAAAAAAAAAALAP